MRSLILVFCIFFLSISYAQDSTYIKKFPYNGTLELNSGLFTQDLDLHKKGNHGDTAHSVFKPNANNTIGFNVSWKFLSLGYSFKVPNHFREENKYGNTKYFTLSLSTFFRWFGAEGFFGNYQRFYQSNLKFENISKRPDVAFTHTGVNLYFFTNTKKFCFRAPFTQSRRQLKSAGGIVVLSELAYKKFSGDSSILPSAIDNAVTFDKYAKMKSLVFGIYEVKPGYAYDFVFKNGKYYICPLILAGPGISPYRYLTETSKGNTIALHLDFNFKLAVGYDVEHFFMNIIFQADRNSNYLRKNLVFDHTVFRMDYTAGFRFGKKKAPTKK